MTQNELIVPIYIDTNALLDLLATVEGGFTIVEKLSTSSKMDSRTEGSADGRTEFGIPNVLNLVKLNLNIGVQMRRDKRQELGETREMERYHTYGSLLGRLRTYLREKNLIIDPTTNHRAWENIRVSDFIEIGGRIYPNPLIDTLSRFESLIQLVENFPPELLPTAGTADTNLTKKRHEMERKFASGIKKFIQSMKSDIQPKDAALFIMEADGSIDLRVVVLLFLSYLRDSTLTEVNDRYCRLLGKVVRKVNSSDNRSISLLRGTALGTLEPAVLQEMDAAFRNLGVRLPELITEVSAPALEVSTIALFV